MAYLALDTETTGLDWRTERLLGLGYYASEDDKGWLTDPAEIDRFFEERRARGDFFIWCNAPFDRKVLLRAGCSWAPCDLDLKLAADLLPNRPKGLSLEEICWALCRIPPWKEEAVRDAGGQVPIDVTRDYCLTDCRNTLAAAEALIPALEACGQATYYYQRRQPYSDLLTRVEYRGVAFNRAAGEKYHTDLLAEIAALESKLETEGGALVREYEEAEIQKVLVKRKAPPTPQRLEEIRREHAFNWGSDDQVLWLLHFKLGLPCRHPRDRYDKSGTRKIKGGYTIAYKKGDPTISTDEDTLTLYLQQHPLIQVLLDYRHAIKLEGYVAAWMEASEWDGRIHTSFNLTNTETGRTSSSGPNLQQVPKPEHDGGRARGLFMAEPGRKLVIADMRQIEPRLLAHYSKSPTLIRCFELGVDFYSVIAKVAVPACAQTPLPEIKVKHPKERGACKTVGLGWIYNLRAFGTQQIFRKALGTQVSYEEAEGYRRSFFQGLPEVVEFKDTAQQFAEREGYVPTLYGMRSWVKKGSDIQNAVNRVIQPSASDVLLDAQVRLSERLLAEGIDAYLVLTVHDEVVYSVKEEALDRFIPALTEAMTKSVQLRCPLDIELFTGDTWAEKH